MTAVGVETNATPPTSAGVEGVTASRAARVEFVTTPLEHEPDAHPSDWGADDLQEAHDTVAVLSDENEAQRPVARS